MKSCHEMWLEKAVFVCYDLIYFHTKTQKAGKKPQLMQNLKISDKFTGCLPRRKAGDILNTVSL